MFGRTRGRPSNKMNAALDVARAMVQQTGKAPSRSDVAKAAAVHNSTADIVVKIVQAELAASATLSQPQFTKAQENHIEAKIRARMREMEKEFDARVTAENKRQIDILFPDLEQLQESARLNEKYYRERLESVAIFTEGEYRDILLCTHEANPSAETRQRAFMALNRKKLLLTGKKTAPKHLQTAEECLNQ